MGLGFLRFIAYFEGMELSSKISGDIDVMYAMQNLPRAMQTKALRPALRAGGELVRKAAIANVKRVAIKGRSTGKLARSIIARNARKKSGQLRVVVAVAAGRVYPSGTRVGLVGSVLEFGKKGQAPAPWLRPALRSTANSVYNVVLSVSRQNLSKAIEDARR